MSEDRALLSLVRWFAGLPVVSFDGVDRDSKGRGCVITKSSERKPATSARQNLRVRRTVFVGAYRIPSGSERANSSRRRSSTLTFVLAG